MLINQISVFLENKSGQLADFIKILADNKIDIQAFSIAEKKDYGLLRVIVDKPEETINLLKQNNIVCKITQVLAVTVPDKPGSLSKLLSVLADNNISLEYSYAFFSRDKGNACIIMRVDDNEQTMKLLNEAGVII